MKKTAATKQKTTTATGAPEQEAVTVARQPKKATRPARKAKATKPTAKKAKGISAGSPPKPSSKRDQVLAMIRRPKGASLDEIMVAMNWQRHTVRGFISILNKAGAKIASSKSEAGARTYKAA